jgi:hypothetical protein
MPNVYYVRFPASDRKKGTTQLRNINSGLPTNQQRGHSTFVFSLVKELCIFFVVASTTCFVASVASAQLPSSTSIAGTYGSGPDESYLVVNFDNGPGGANDPASNFVFGYLYGGVSNPAPNAYDMIEGLTNVGLLSTTTYYSSFAEHEIDTFSFSSNTSGAPTGYDNSTGAYWNYFWGTTSTINPSGTTGWTTAGSGIDDETLTNGSVDGWVWESSAPAPEASSCISMALGLCLVAVLALVQSRKRSLRSAQ